MNNIPSIFIDLPCPRCRAIGGLRASQQIFKSQLRWSEMSNCKSCGLISEADGAGFLPSAMRKRFIETHGAWQARLTELKSVSAVIKIIREVFSLQLADARKLIKGESKIVYSGTKSECLWLGQLFEAAGESLIVEGVDTSSN